MTGENPPAVPLDKPSAPRSVRASDADRDRIADILREALAEGRIDAEEHSDRVEAAYRAKTLAELEPLIHDLPAGQGAPRPAAPPRSPGAPQQGGCSGSHVVAVLSGASRQGRWRVGGQIHAVAICGGVDLDLTEAIFEQQQVVIHAFAVCGGVDIKVPENVTLRAAGSGVMGGFDVRETESLDPGAPIVTIKGLAVCGGVEAKPVPGKRVRDLRAE